MVECGRPDSGASIRLGESICDVKTYLSLDALTLETIQHALVVNQKFATCKSVIQSTQSGHSGGRD